MNFCLATCKAAIMAVAHTHETFAPSRLGVTNSSAED
jgi:hypothetical protein